MTTIKEKCTCLHCKRSARIGNICKKLSSNDAKFIKDIFDEFAECQEELNWIQADLSAFYFNREKLKMFFGFTDKQLGDFITFSRRSGDEDQEQNMMWVATRRPFGKTVIASNVNYDKCVNEALSKGVKKPCLMLLPISKEKTNGQIR